MGRVSFGAPWELRSRWLGEEGEGWKPSLGHASLYDENRTIFDEHERISVQDRVSEAKWFFKRMPSAKELLTLQIPLSFDRSGRDQPLCQPSQKSKYLASAFKTAFINRVYGKPAQPPTTPSIPHFACIHPSILCD